MKITNFKELHIENFKNHESLTVKFGDQTEITGSNGEGKSGIAESITWLLFGTDVMGNKFDPTPINGEGSPKVEILLNEDGRDLLLGKELIKTAKYFINEVPEKATKFDETVAGLFDKNLFLSIFNPSYFFSQHWQDQRSQLLKYVSEPLNKEVLAALPKLNKDRLENRLKKNSLEDLEKIYKPQIKTKETEYERAAERYLTLKDRLEQESADIREVDKDKIQSEMDEIKKTVSQAQENNRKVKQQQEEYHKLMTELTTKKDYIDVLAARVKEMLSTPVSDTCEACGQSLEGESFEKAQHNHQHALEKQKEEGTKFVNEFKEIQKKLNDFKPESDVEMVDVSELQETYFQLQNDLTAADRIAKLAEDVKHAEKNKDDVRLELGEARGIVDAIKDFNTKKSELMVEKVNGLLDQLSVKLFEEKKNGSIVPTFEVEMDGKPYRKLSTAEKIKAGLELAEVLIKQSEKSVPVFVDNAESIIKFTAPNAQLITSKVKPGNLKIEVKGDK